MRRKRHDRLYRSWRRLYLIIIFFFEYDANFFFRFWNLEQSSAEKAGIQPTYQGIQPTSPLPTPLGVEHNFVFLSLR